MSLLVLASSSPYRRALLERLALPFECAAPQIDEKAMAQETPAELAARLAAEKTLAVASRYADRVIIGSDQVASLKGQTLGKPGDFETAREQLARCSGESVDFYTGMCVFHRGRLHHAMELYSVEFRELGESAIEAYLRLEEPYDCAGSFKWEGLGISLFKRMSGDDPTSLQGLPLISLCNILRDIGMDPLQGQVQFQ